ncbi:MAG: glycosyltransferase [Alphaproteobacteria bacterium]|nr:glycosyltransferase [Alphaproteobacteria bacterium]
MTEPRVAVVVKGFPRLSETFIARELAGLEARGVFFSLHALRKPGSDAALVEKTVQAAPQYLPEYLRDAPVTVARAFAAAVSLPGFAQAWRAFRADLRSEFAAGRVRRFGQACVLAQQMPPSVRHVYAHFAHSPSSVARYAALLRGVGFSISAHAKDIWTAADWDLSRKIADASFVTVCNRAGHERLVSLGAGSKLKLIHHGVARSLLASAAPSQSRDGRDVMAPVRFVAVARAVEKKGLRRLLDALALLPRDLAFRLDHYGGGDLMDELRNKTRSLALEERVTWHGARPHREIVAALDQADVFVLPAVIGSDGDRDGIPNAVMEAQARGLCVVASRVGGIDEVVRDGVSGRLVEAGDVAGLASALTAVARDPALRARLGAAALVQVARDCDAEASYDAIAALLRERI